MPTRRLLLVAAALLLISLLAHLPARLLIPDGPIGAIRLERIGGDWRHGVAMLTAPRPTPALQLSWTLAPMRLLVGELTYGMRATGGGLRADAEVALGVGGSLTLRTADLAWAPDAMPLRAPLPGTASFNATLDLAQLVIVDGAVREAMGHLTVQDLRISAAGEQLRLGDFVSEISASDGALRLPLRSSDGELGISGELYLTPGGHLRGALILHPDARTPERVMAAVTAFARPLADGSYQIGIDLQL